MSKSGHSRTGIAMLLVLVLVVVASVLGMSYLSVTTVKLAGSTNLLRASRARYLAESGLLHGLYLLRTDSPLLCGVDAHNPLGPYHADGSDDAYVLYSEPVGVLTYRLTAKGTCRGLTRTSSLTARLYSTYRDKLKSLGPLAYWRLGELSGPVADDCVASNDGTYENGVALGQPGAVCGDLDAAARFDGQNDYVDLGKLDVGGSKLTILAWFKAEDFAVADGRIISKAIGLDNGLHYWMISTIAVNEDMRLRFRLRTSGLTTYLVATSGNLVADKWTFAAATYDGAYMTLYKDGEDVGNRPKSGSIDTSSITPVWIGSNPPGEPMRPFHGLIDEVVILGSCLSQDQIQSLNGARIASVKILSWDR
jgi:hypothetical protein